VAKPKKLPPPSLPDPGAALSQAEAPRIRWGVVAQFVLGFLIVWALAIGSVPYLGWWLVGLVGLATVALGGVGIYAWRLVVRQRRLLQLLKRASDEAGRKAAMAELEAQGSKDALAALARAQLVLRDDPKEAIRILEGIDLTKEPGPVQDEVRANLAFLYLLHNRPKDARPLVDELRLDRQPNSKAKAMYAAVMAETFARTGKPEEAKKLLEIYSPDDPAYGEVALVLLRAQVYTYHATKNRGLMRKAMRRIAEKEPNQLAPFAVKGAHPELQRAVREVLAEAGFQTRDKMKVQRK